MSSSSEQVSCSAPGKVLIAGGYQVLERPLPGLVFTTDARFHCICSTRASLDDSVALRLFVSAEQLEARYVFAARRDDSGRLAVELVDGPRNPFVLQAICTAVAIAGGDGVQRFTARTGSNEIDVRVFGDNAFYVQTENLRRHGLDFSTASLERLPPWQPVSRDASSGNLHKTGLGSSAALVVSVVGALCRLVSPPSSDDDDDDDWLLTVYRGAQLAHCAAQGKVGSGFDVSAAVYGSHKYVRFSPAVLAPLLDSLAGGAPVDVDQLRAGQWDDVRTPLRLPAGVRLVLGDVSGGSDTPSMVRKVLDGLATDARAAELWRQLAVANQQLEGAVNALLQQAPDAYQQELERFAGGGDLDDSGLLAALRRAFESARALMRELGVVCQVPIEPPEQTALIDATLALGGVLFAGVPGAGGYDAIFVVCLDRAAVVEAIDACWAKWPRPVYRLAVKQDDQGVLFQ